jgi:hypothetical protein
MPRCFEKLLVWLVLGAYAVTGALAVEGVQLCFEPDGHVSLEVIAAGCGDCCPEDGPERDAGARVESCPCVDVSLAVPVASSAKTKSEGEWVAAALPSGGWHAVAQLAHARPLLSTRPHVRASSPVELLRSVVLRV